MIKRCIILLTIPVLILNGCITASPQKAEPTKSGPPGPGQVVVMPRVWLESRKALGLAGKAGSRYVVTARQLRGLVGPFALDQKLSPTELLEQVAQAEGLEISWVADIALLQPKADTRGIGDACVDANSPDISKRRHSIFALSESRRFESIAPLARLAAEKDRAVRRAALLGLASLEGDFEYNQWPGRMSVYELESVKLNTDLFLWLLEEGAETGGEEWRAVVSILGRAREGQLPRAVWESVWNKTPGAIMPAIWAMGRCHDPDMRATLEKRLRQTFTNDESDRYTVAATLGRLGMLSVLSDHAAFTAKKPAEQEIRCAAVYGMGFCSQALDALQKALGDPDQRVREIAVFAIGNLDGAQAQNALKTLLADEKIEPAMRAAAARALADSAGSAALDVLVPMTKTGDARVRAAVAEALGRTGGSRAVDALQPMLADADRWVAAAAGKSLAEIGHVSKSSKPAVAELLMDPKTDPEVRTAIAIGMGLGHDPAFAAALGAVAGEGAAEPRLREYAARALTMLANNAGQAELVKLMNATGPSRMTGMPVRFLDLGDPNATVAALGKWLTAGAKDEQELAAERIAELGTTDGTRLLAGGFNAFDNHTRFTHVWALLHSDNPVVRATLIDILKNSRRSGMRLNAALAMGGRSDPDVIQALISAAKDENVSVRKGVANALGQCGDPAAVTTLAEMMEKDPDIGVAHQALRALRNRGLAGLPEARAALQRVAGTDRDCGAQAGGTSMAQQAANSWVLRRYALEYDDNTIPNLTYESALTYDALNHRVVQWGSHGRRADSPQTGLTWIYEPGANNWRRPSPSQEPPGVCLTRTLVFDPVRGLAISPAGVGGGHGWVMALRKRTAWSVPWVFDVRKEQWYRMHPLFAPGNCTESSSCFDSRNDVMILGAPSVLVYDSHVNEWVQMRPPAPLPERNVGAPCGYDPVTGRFMLLAGSDVQGRGITWAYDLPGDRWINLGATNAPAPMPGNPMVYDSANDVFLALHSEKGRIVVNVYHPRENRWETMPAVYPAPNYGQFDAAYDPVHNVVVICGGWEWGQSSAVTQRETWTYRYKPFAPDAARKREAAIVLAAGVGDDGRISLSWTAGTGVNATKGFNIYRGSGERTWLAKMEKITKEPVTTTNYIDTAKLEAGAHYYYRLAAVGTDGREEVVSNLARTQPMVVREVQCARNADGSVGISWAPYVPGVIAGYNVYRAPGQKMDLWRNTFYAEKNAGKFEKLNKELVRETVFVDKPGDVVARCSESTWMPLQVYIVKAVNARGEESGASPAVLSIPAPPNDVLPVRMEDGRCLVTCAPESGLATRGRFLWREDSYKADWVFRSAAAPHPGLVFVDDTPRPAGDRSMYFVVAVDEVGQLGVPSAEAWLKHRP